MLGNQLKFDKDFNSIVNKAPSFWSKITDIPNNIRYFIDEISNNIVIYDYPYLDSVKDIERLNYDDYVKTIKNVDFSNYIEVTIKNKE